LRWNSSSARNLLINYRWDCVGLSKCILGDIIFKLEKSITDRQTSDVRDAFLAEKHCRFSHKIKHSNAYPSTSYLTRIYVTAAEIVRRSASYLEVGRAASVTLDSEPSLTSWQTLCMQYNITIIYSVEYRKNNYQTTMSVTTTRIFLIHKKTQQIVSIIRKIICTTMIVGCT